MRNDGREQGYHLPEGSLDLCELLAGARLQLRQLLHQERIHRRGARGQDHGRRQRRRCRQRAWYALGHQ